MGDSSESKKTRTDRSDERSLEARLRAAARRLFPDRTVDDLEIRHLSKVVAEGPHLEGVYSDERIRRIMRPDRSLVDRLLGGIDSRQGEERTHPFLGRRLPDDVRIVGDKALFDLGLLGLQRIKGYDLAELGARAYRRAGDVLELLAEDRRLREFFKQNRLLMLPLEEEVVFLRRCSERFREYADLLHRIQHDDADSSIAEIVARVPLMAAVAEALAADVAPDVAGGEAETGRPEDAYLFAAQGERVVDDELGRASLISGYERMLLFSTLSIAQLKGAMKATVIDQERAVDELCDDFSLFAAGTRDRRKPPGYFLVGPTGVGKNHLVESLCRLLEGVWKIEIPMLTIEGPNYTYPSDINELRGATRGFIRSDEEGLLTAFHARSSQAPLGVILVDEVEKAHPHLLTFFLSILDRGTTTDNRGTELNFANCLMFFTSNLGYSDAQQGAAPIGYRDEAEREQVADQGIRRELRGKLKPEFVNRVKLIHFNRLTRSSAERILELELERIARRYRRLHGLTIELDPSARDELVARGFSPTFGARHLASTLESVCNVEIAKKIREDDRGEGPDRAELIAWLREMREGERPFASEEVRERVVAASRARLDYDRLRIRFADGAFVYEPVRSDGPA